MTVQIFDATVQDNRHICLTGLKEREWTTTHLNFSRDSRRNDGIANSPFDAGRASEMRANPSLKRLKGRTGPKGSWR